MDFHLITISIKHTKFCSAALPRKFRAFSKSVCAKTKHLSIFMNKLQIEIPTSGDCSLKNVNELLCGHRTDLI